jgi:hypothetical protein
MRHALDVGVAQERATPLSGQGQRGAVDGQRDVVGGAHDDAPGRGHHLLVAPHLVGAWWQPPEEVARGGAV